MRLGFVGQRASLAYASLLVPAGGIEARFFDWRPGGDADLLLAELGDFAPDVVICWRPELFPDGLFAELDALTVGYLPEPLPRPDGIHHPDLTTRLSNLEA